MAKLIMVHSKKGTYTNTDAVEKLIRYITRTRKNEDRYSELIAYGGSGINYNFPVDEIIKQFKYIQNLYNINNRCGRRMYHEILSFTDTEYRYLNYDINKIKEIAESICKDFFIKGFQVLYGIHYSEKSRLHIHFAVNTINFRTGLKLHSTMSDLEKREIYSNTILRAYSIRLGTVISPILFDNGIIEIE